LQLLLISSDRRRKKGPFRERERETLMDFLPFFASRYSKDVFIFIHVEVGDACVLSMQGLKIGEPNCSPHIITILMIFQA
jgi:hypothetical protein